jgi:dienelactone hydrolase
LSRTASTGARELIAGTPARIDAARNQVALSAINALAVHLGSLTDRRKTLIVATEGVGRSDRRRGQEYLPTLETIIRSANRSNVAIYPFDPRDHRAVPTPNPLGMSKGPFPLLLYAHGFRAPSCTVASPINGDFTTVETMLRHVASWGCVCVAPDLSWLPGILLKNDPTVERDAFDLRAVVLADYLTYLADVLNTPLFAKQLDFSRVVLVGHSTGAGGATHAGSIIGGFGHATSLSYGLIAPVAKPTNADAHNLLVLGGGQDTRQGADPLGAFTAGGTPKTLATIPGANHFGYTDLCDANNTCEPFGVIDPNGTISRAQQQLAGAAYLTALLRYYTLGDATARLYLSGQQAVEGLESLGIQVQAQGFVTRPTPPVVPTTTHTPVVQP